MPPGTQSQNAAGAAAGAARVGEPRGRGASDRTWTRFRSNLARHLIGVSRDLQSRLMTELTEEGGFEGLRPSFGALMSLIWTEGLSLSAVAEHLGISKQACSQLSTSIERAGYLERVADPQDRRSKLLRLTPRGVALVEASAAGISRIEAEYSGLLGQRAYRSFSAALAQLYQGLRIPTHANPSLTAEGTRSVGVLPMIAVRIEQELMTATIAAGHRGLKMSHGQVLPLIGPDGGRVHEIARLQRVTRQAIHATSVDLEGLGYLSREADPRDRRGVVFRLTSRGASLIRDSVEAIDGLEALFEGLLGAPALAELKTNATALYDALHLEQEIFAASGSVEDAAVRPRGLAAGRGRVERLAAQLRDELGARDAARLGALLAPTASTRSKP